ncbi:MULTISPECIES: hypothetical protein [Aequorivita]|uniref:Uncharacterized protein n=2 Tax=Aequorivita TaxID=153265 RepID=A0AB35YTI3_9FLAO|nr:hypothetical protein [Aequorivita sp. Ant34-E75]WGF91362.1 hypothetical protein QCQ61_09065 [Aequorivita sp. Ant34-E75]
MEEKANNKPSKIYQYILLALVGYIGILTGYHTFKIIQYFFKSVPNPLMPLDLYKYIAFPYLSFIPFLLGLLILGLYFARRKYFKKKHVILYVILILVFHLSQTSLLELFDGFNPYGG